MEYTYEFFEKSAQYVREKLDFQPEIGIILGSSLGPFAAQVESPVVIPYEDIRMQMLWGVLVVYLEVQHPCWSCNSSSLSANASAGVR